MLLKKHIPNSLSISRFIIAGVLLYDAHDGHVSRFFNFLFFLGFLTDFLDGFLARRWKVASVWGARLDGYADMALHIGILVAGCFLFPQVIAKYSYVIGGLLALQAVSWMYSYLKFRKVTSYHTYMAKLWGVVAFLSLCGLFIFQTEVLLPAMFGVAGISIIEDLAITAVLPYWMSDIKGLPIALRISNEYKK